MGGGKPSAKYITAAVVTFVGVLLASVLKGPKPGRPIQNARYAIDLEALETARACTQASNLECCGKHSCNQSRTTRCHCF